MTYHKILLHVSTTRINTNGLYYVLTMSCYIFLFIFTISHLSFDDIYEVGIIMTILMISFLRHLFYSHIFWTQIQSEIYEYLHRKKLFFVRSLEILLIILGTSLIYINSKNIAIYIIACSPIINVFIIVVTYSDIVVNISNVNTDDIYECIINLIKLNKYQPFKKATFGKLTDFIDEENPFVICSICAENINTQDEPVCKLCCNHLFHGKCIIPWLYKKANCPNCRHIIDSNISQRYTNDTQYGTDNNVSLLIMTDGMNGLF